MLAFFQKALTLTKWKIPGMLLLLILLLIFYYSILNFKIPKIWYSSELFSPLYFAASKFLPSLGHSLIITLLVFFFVYTAYKTLSVSFPINEKTNFKQIFLKVFLLLLIISDFLFLHYLFRNIIINSRISL